MIGEGSSACLFGALEKRDCVDADSDNIESEAPAAVPDAAREDCG